MTGELPGLVPLAPVSVTLLIPGVLRRYSADEAEVTVAADTVGDALEALFERHPKLRERVLDRSGRLYPYLLLFRNEHELERDGLASVALEPGDRLDLLAAAEGGAPEDAGNLDTRDVRMRGFRERATVESAREVAFGGLAPLAAEEVAVSACAGRLLAEDVTAAVDVPPFRRAAMDGFAVVAADTFGATMYDPLRLEVADESMPGPGEPPPLDGGQACRIMTGARLPEGADAVLMAEDAEEDGAHVLVRAAVTPGKNVGQVGEDIARGEVVLATGRRLRPQDAGLLASIGHHPVRVRRRPRVRILVSGNELLPPGEKPGPGRIVDSNTPMLTALLERDGGELESAHRLPDDAEAIRAALAAKGADVILAAGGSSVGREDHLPMLVRELGELPVHGIAMRPSSPTGLGRIGDARVFLLPGNPVSCLCAYDFFAGPAIRALGGRSTDWPYAEASFSLSRRIASRIGRVDYVRVTVADGAAAPLAISGASILSSTTRADGFVVVPADSEGMAEGDEVRVRLYDVPA